MTERSLVVCAEREEMAGERATREEELHFDEFVRR